MKKDQERLEMFRRVRSEIRGSNQYLVVSIHVGQEKHHAWFGTPTGGTLQEALVFGNHRVGFEHLIARADALEVELGLSQVVFGLKPNQGYHKPLLEYLMGRDEFAVLVSTGRVEGNPGRLDGPRPSETPVDLAAVEERVSRGQFHWVPAADPELDALRQAVQMRVRRQRQEQALRRRLRHHLIAPYFPELSYGYGAGTEPHDEVVLKIARTCFDPEAIASMGFDAFWKQLAEPRWGQRHAARMLAVWQAAPDSIGCAVQEAVAWQARTLVDEVTHARWELAELDELIRQLAQRRPGYESLLSLPGVGPSAAALVLAALGDPHRFTHHRQVLRLAGLDRCPQRGSTRRKRAGPSISRHGSAPLRGALLHAARAAVRCHPTLRTAWARPCQGRDRERGSRRQRELQLAAHLLVLACALLKREGRFDPERFASDASSAPWAPPCWATAPHGPESVYP